MLPPWQSSHASRSSVPGRLGSALAQELRRAGYRITEIVSGNSTASRRKARAVAKRVHASASEASHALDADLVWFCVPDREIAKAARQLAKAGRVERQDCVSLQRSPRERRTAGAAPPRRGRSVGTSADDVCRGSVPSLQGVPFALEGDARALRAARELVRDLGAEAFSISKRRSRPITLGERSLRRC